MQLDQICRRQFNFFAVDVPPDLSSE